MEVLKSLSLITILLVIDYALGIYRAVRHNEYSSGKMRDGLVKNLLILTALTLLHIYAKDYGLDSVALLAISAFSIQTISSIIENYIAIGGKIPKQVAEIFNSKVKEIK